MRKQADLRPHLASPKGESFGAALRGAIKAEFGTNKAFSVALGVSQGRVSQIIKGPEEVNPQSLGKVIAAFSSFGLQERIHAAWIREFVPLTSGEERASSEVILEQIKVVGKDLSPRRALKIASRQRKVESDTELRQRLLRRIIQLYQRLGETAPALRGAMELEAQSKAENDSLGLIAAMWLRGNVLRGIDPLPPKVLLASHQAATAYADAVKPKGGPGLAEWKKRRFELERDFALHVVKIDTVMPVREEMLRAALGAVNRSIDTGISDESSYIGLEVRARVEIAMGRLSDAEDTLDEVAQRSHIEGTEVIEKTSITRATLLQAQGETEAAEAMLLQIARKCLDEENLHHYRVADRRLTQLLLGGA